jgi:hypothetical protein
VTHTLKTVGYALDPGRCVIEVTKRPLVRVRFQATEGELVPGVSLTLTVDPGSLKTAIPWLGPALRGPKYLSTNDILFEATQDGNDFAGRLTVQGAWYDLVLRSRIVYADEDTVIISARGRIRRLAVEIAAEFGR